MKTLLTVCTLSILVLAPALSHSDPVVRGGTVPSSNLLTNSPMLGDMWTFQCPTGGTVSVLVDTINDLGTGATLDPFFQIMDGDGTNLDGPQGFVDDTVACTITTVCAFTCPRVVDRACGSKNPHSILIGNADNGGPCIGGGYVLTVEVKDNNGVSLNAKKAKLGGGNKRKLPKWANPDGSNKEGPALDSEVVPFDF